MKRLDISATERDYALSVLGMYRGDMAKAAKFLGIPVKTLRAYQRDADAGDAPEQPVAFASPGRPQPPDSFCDEDEEEALFSPAPDLLQWVRETFLTADSPLYNEEHEHLLDADLAFLWTNVAYRRGGRDIAGQAEMPSCQGNVWLKQRVEFQLRHWFGTVPDFLITLYAPTLRRANDATFCAIVEHELYHCGQRLDPFGAPAFSRVTQMPLFYIRGHDVEEFTGIVRRYGVGAASAGVNQLVYAASKTPEIGEADLALACGTCGAKNLSFSE
jgi:hypothetical protein